MQGLDYKRVYPHDKEYRDVFELREAVLRKPIGLSLYDEDLSSEVNDYILVALLDDNIIACLILTPIANDTVQLRQMAVSELLQGKSIGKKLVEYAEQFAWQQGYTSIMLHARIVAKGFYEKLGYKQQGDVFTEVGIPHVEMQKDKA